MKPLELIKKVFGSVIKSKLIQKDLAEVVYFLKCQMIIWNDLAWLKGSLCGQRDQIKLTLVEEYRLFKLVR